MNGGLPVRISFFAIAALAGWILLSAYAGRVFLACAAVARHWRLWRVARGTPLSATRARRLIRADGQRTRHG